MAPRQNIAVRELLFQLSPYQQSIIGQTFKNAPKTFMHFVAEKGPGLLILAGSYFGALEWTKYEMEKEKLSERF